MAARDNVSIPRQARLLYQTINSFIKRNKFSRTYLNNGAFLRIVLKPIQYDKISQIRLIPETIIVKFIWLLTQIFNSENEYFFLKMK
jgi:hypothetical protein